MKDKLLNTREVSHILGLSEKEIIDLANSGLIPHFQLGGEFLRFKREDILKIKEDIKKKYSLPYVKSHRKEKIKEFFYFNDFYIVATVVIIVLIWIIIKDFRP
ncbi:MAG: helix-turn-helix domain-containing protein [Candidatus Omnitrophota bacterium]|nr:MAG: helix-turn-helix domain-containing protein [Candidatus Omnitrophota bacterium]